MKYYANRCTLYRLLFFHSKRELMVSTFFLKIHAVGNHTAISYALKYACEATRHWIMLTFMEIQDHLWEKCYYDKYDLDNSYYNEIS